MSFNPDSCTAGQRFIRSIDNFTRSINDYLMGIAVRMTCLNGNDRVIGSVLPVETDLVHIDMYSLYHFFLFMMDANSVDKSSRACRKLS